MINGLTKDAKAFKDIKACHTPVKRYWNDIVPLARVYSLTVSYGPSNTMSPREIKSQPRLLHVR